MGFRSNQPTTGRRFVFTQGAGDNTLEGTSDELPLADPYEAVARINALTPPVSSLNRASLEGAGTFFSGITLPRYVALIGANTSFIATDPILVASGGDQTIELGSIINHTSTGVLLDINAKNRMRCLINALVVDATGSTGIRLQGACDDIFIAIVAGEIRGADCVMVNHTALSQSPITYNFEVVEYFNTGQTFFKYEPQASSNETILEIGAIQPDPTSTTTGSIGVDCVTGILVVDAKVISAETMLIVRDTAIISVITQASGGKLSVLSGGQGIIYSGRHLGDIEINAGGALFADSSFISGNVTVAGTATLNANKVVGDLNIDGALNTVIHEHIGNITGTGTVNGIINGVRYGNWVVKDVEKLHAFSLVDQNPVGTNTPYQITFGAAQPGTEVSLAANGAVTFHKAGQYDVLLYLQFGRAGSGSVSWIFARILINGVQMGNPIFTKLDGANDDLPVEYSLPNLSMTVNDVMTFEIVRDSQGNNSGGLLSETSNVGGWGSAPSAAISVYGAET